MMPDLLVSQDTLDLAAITLSVSPSQMDIAMHITEKSIDQRKMWLSCKHCFLSCSSILLSLYDPGLLIQWFGELPCTT